MGSRTRKATFLHYRLARPPTSVCRTSGLRSWTAGPSIVCLKTNQRPLWASGILLYLPTHRASEHRYLLLRGPVFLFDVTCVYRSAGVSRPLTLTKEDSCPG